jgi:hypothetical protein
LSSSPRCKALLLSSSIPHSGDWLHVVPSPALGLHLKDPEFRSCLKYPASLGWWEACYPICICDLSHLTTSELDAYSS